MEEKASTKPTRLPWFGVKKLWPYVHQYKGLLIGNIIMGFIASMIDAIYPLFNRYALNHFVAQKTLDTLGIFVALYAGILLLQVVDNLICTYRCGRIEMSINRDLRNLSFNHLQTLSFSYFSQNNVGYIHSRVMSDTGRIGELFAWDLMVLIWDGSYILCILIVMFTVNARLAWYVVALVPLAILIISLFQGRLTKLHQRIREINSTISGDFNEGITGIRSIKTLVIEKTIQKDFEKDTTDMRKTSVRMSRMSAVFISLMTLMSSIALAVVLWQGGTMSIRGIMEIGTLSVFMNYALGILTPIQEIIDTISTMIQVQVNIGQFTKLMETKSDVADTPEVVAKYGDTFHPKKENWEPLIGDVEFDDVSFRYPDGNEWVLEHFNLKVPHGTNVAIVGETGAGKSTLVNLVCRFYEPTKGRILIDGRDARQRSQLWLHSNIGYVLQTPHLFSGTVRDNLRYGNPNATDEQILQALKMVKADFVMDKLDKGLDSEVGEGGELFSTGEKQLISFARALLADPKILVLDEATSSIDTITEKAIQEAIATVIKGRTSFVIAHRLSTITGADVILVVRDGKIVEKGTHQQLLAKKGYYYELYTRQFEELSVNMATQVS